MPPDPARAQTPTPTPPGALLPPDPLTLNQVRPYSRFIYLVPFNREPAPDWELRYRYMVETAHEFYLEQTERNGFESKTFAYETKPDGVSPVIHLIDIRNSGLPDAARLTDSWFYDVPQRGFGWPGGGQAVTAHRVLIPWIEGEGIGAPPDDASAPPGVTWNSPGDPDTADLDPSGGDLWDMDSVSPPEPVYTTIWPASAHFPADGEIVWDVYDDVKGFLLAGITLEGWLLRLEDESRGGHSHFYTRESDYPPRLELRFLEDADPTVLLAEADTYIKKSSEDWNQGGEETMQVRRGPYPYRSLVRFSATEIQNAAAGKMITGAELRLRAESGFGSALSRKRAIEVAERMGFISLEENALIVIEASYVNQNLSREGPWSWGGGQARGDSGTGSSAHFLAAVGPDRIADTSAAGVIPGIGSHGLVFGGGGQVSQIASTSLGIFMHEHGHAMGALHDLVNDGNLGNLMGAGAYSIRGWIHPECFPTSTTRLSIMVANQFNSATCFNAGIQPAESDPPFVSICSALYNNDSGQVEVLFAAEDPSGLSMAFLRQDASVSSAGNSLLHDSNIAYLDLRGLSQPSYQISTPFLDIDATNSYSLFVRDIHGNSFNQGFAVFVDVSESGTRALQPAIRAASLPAEAEVGEMITLSASLSPADPSAEFLWDTDGNGSYGQNPDLSGAGIVTLGAAELSVPGVRQVSYQVTADKDNSPISVSVPIGIRVEAPQPDPPFTRIEFSTDAQLVFEGDSLGGALIKVVLSDEDCLGGLSVGLSAIAIGSATPGDDYDPAGGTVTFLPGQTTAYFLLPITDDGDNNEGAETFQVTLHSPSGGVLGDITTQTITIYDTFCCPGDADHNGSVNANDFITVMAHFGQVVPRGGIGDANCSGGAVNSADFLAVSSGLGRLCAGSSPLPEAPTPTPDPFPPSPTPTPAPPCPPGFCPGDADHSGAVNAADFFYVQSHFGDPLSSPGDCGDANCSGGAINADDILAVQANFGALCPETPPPCGNPSPTPTPTPCPIPPGGQAPILLPPVLHFGSVECWGFVGGSVCVPLMLNLNEGNVQAVGAFVSFDSSISAFAGGEVKGNWDDHQKLVAPRLVAPGLVALHAAMLSQVRVLVTHANEPGEEPVVVAEDGVNVPVALLDFELVAPGISIVSAEGEPGRESVTVSSNLTVNSGTGLGETTVLSIMYPPSSGDLADWVGMLPDDAFKQPGANRRNTLLNKIEAVSALIAQGEIDAAVSKLENDIRAKTDGVPGGGNPNDDWITDDRLRIATLRLIDAILGVLRALL